MGTWEHADRLGLLLQGDNLVQLVVLCADKPTQTLLKRVAAELPVQLKAVSEEHKYTISTAPLEGAVLVSDGTVSVKVSLTSPLLRDPQQGIFTCSLLALRFGIFALVCFGPFIVHLNIYTYTHISHTDRLYTNTHNLTT